MQHAHEQEREGPGEVDERPGQLVVQDLIGAAQVGLEHLGGAAGQQGAPVGAYDGVVVDVENPCAAGDLLGDLVHVSRGGQAGADVDELPDPVLLGEDPHHPAQERPVSPGDERQLRHHLDELVSRGTVGREVVLALEEVVVHPGDVGRGGVQSSRFLS